MKRLLVEIAICSALVLGLVAHCSQVRTTRLVTEKVKLDTVYVERKLTLTKVRTVTDSVLKTDTLFRDTTVKRIVADERKACSDVVTTCEKKVKNLEAQLKPGWLKVFGALAYQPPVREPILQGPSFAEAGAALRIHRDIWLEAYRSVPLTGDSTAKSSWNVRVKKEVRIF